MPDFDEQQTLLLISLLTNVLSFLSSLWLLCSYSQSHQSTQSKMVINIVLSNCLISITGFLAFLLDREDSFFKINGLLSMIAVWSSAYWSVSTSILLYKKISNPTTFNSNMFYTYSLIAWGGLCLLLPVILTTVIFNLLDITFAIFPNRFEKDDTTGSDYILLFSLIEWLPFGGSIFLTFISTIKQIKIIKEFYVSNFGDIQTSKLFKYPIALTLIFLPSLVCKTWFMISPYNSLILDSIRLFGYYLAGLIHFFVYRIQGYDPKAAKTGLVTAKVVPAGAGGDMASRWTNADEEDCEDEEDPYHYRTV